MPLDTVKGTFTLLGKHLSRLSDDLVSFFVKNADALGDDADRAYAELRPVSLEAVRAVFALEMDRTLRKATESGKTAVFTRRKSTKKKKSG
jgi:hypothetical protein